MSKWINTKDKLPLTDGHYLVTKKYVNDKGEESIWTHVCRFAKGKWETTFEILAWKELEQPYMELKELEQEIKKTRETQDNLIYLLRHCNGNPNHYEMFAELLENTKIDLQYLEKTLVNKINKNKKLKNKVEKELSEDTGENFIEEEKITS